MPIMLI